MDRDRRRRFGQNFLEDAMAQAIAWDLPILSHEAILEIGPGHGAMTKHLLPRCSRLAAVEIDPECASLLKAQFAQYNFQVYCQDFMEFDLKGWIQQSPPTWIAGNLPYNVATAILVKIMPLASHFRGIMAMTQLEVAERICALPGSRAYGSLSVLASAYTQRKILRKVGPEHFSPRPNVQSATFLLEPRPNAPQYPPGFFDFVQQCFAHKRKRLSNSLESHWTKMQIQQVVAAMGKTEHCRAEELSLDDFLELFERLHSLLPAEDK